MAKKQAQRRREEEEERRAKADAFQAQGLLEEEKAARRARKEAPVVAERKEIAERREFARELRREERFAEARVLAPVEKRELSLLERMRLNFAEFKEFVKDRFPQNRYETTLPEAAESYYFRVSTPPDWRSWAIWLPYEEYEKLCAGYKPLNIMGKIRRLFVGKKKKK